MLGSPLARAEEAPGKGMHWGAEARHQTLPRGFRTNVGTVGTVGTLEDIMFGPATMRTAPPITLVRSVVPCNHRLCRSQELPALPGHGRSDPLNEPRGKA